MLRCVLTRSMLHVVFMLIVLTEKKCIHVCVPSYFIDIIVYIIPYVNVHFCCSSCKSAKIKPNVLLQCIRPKISTYNNRYNLQVHRHLILQDNLFHTHSFTKRRKLSSELSFRCSSLKKYDGEIKKKECRRYIEKKRIRTTLRTTRLARHEGTLVN